MLYTLFRMKHKIIQNIIPTVFAVMVLAIMGNSIQNIAFGQSNSNQTSDNLTKAEITGKPETLIVNKTTIPAEQTTITVDKTTSPVDQSVLQPLQNQTIQEQPLVNLSGIENKTVVEPTGQAQTTMLNTTTVPFEQTIVEGVNQTGQQQQQGQGNQSSGPLEQLGEAITSPFQ